MSEPVDESKLSPQELRLYKLYGKLPSRNEILSHKLQDRKFFDSGDYALNKAGVKIDTLSNRHLTPEQIVRINRNSISGTASSVGKSSLENEANLEEQTTTDK